MGSHAPRSDYRRTGAFAKRIMEEWKASNADVVMQMAILWALIYDSTLVKHIRRKNGRIDPFVVDPACFGVYREDVPMLDRQEAFVHTYYMTKTDLAKRISLHPRRDEILKAAGGSYTKKDIARFDFRNARAGHVQRRRRGKREHRPGCRLHRHACRRRHRNAGDLRLERRRRRLSGLHDGG
jgi:hypothetical protein